MAKKKDITVLIADDQTLFREGIKDILEGVRGIKVIGEAVDGEHAVQQAIALKPDIVLMDIKLPKINGIEATRRIKEKHKHINILMLSSFEDETHIMDALQAGANGYLSKMLPAADVVNAIKTFISQGPLIPDKFMNTVLKCLRDKPLQEDPLTKKEIKILDLMGKGKSNKEIASELECSINTVKNHINSMFQKMRVGNRTGAVLKGIEQGLISPESDVME